MSKGVEPAFVIPSYEKHDVAVRTTHGDGTTYTNQFGTSYIGAIPNSAFHLEVLSEHNPLTVPKADDVHAHVIIYFPGEIERSNLRRSVAVPKGGVMVHFVSYETDEEDRE